MAENLVITIQEFERAFLNALRFMPGSEPPHPSVATYYYLEHYRQAFQEAVSHHWEDIQGWTGYQLARLVGRLITVHENGFQFDHAQQHLLGWLSEVLVMKSVSQIEGYEAHLAEPHLDRLGVDVVCQNGPGSVNIVLSSAFLPMGGRVDFQSFFWDVTQLMEKLCQYFPPDISPPLSPVVDSHLQEDLARVFGYDSDTYRALVGELNNQWAWNFRDRLRKLIVAKRISAEQLSTGRLWMGGLIWPHRQVLSSIDLELVAYSFLRPLNEQES